MKTKLPSLVVRGVAHYYEWMTSGADHQPTGKPIMVFIHGWGGSARYWSTTAQAFCNQYDCLLYDLRGFGRSLASNPSQQRGGKTSPNGAPEFELEAYADDLADIFQRLEISQATIHAHSMGASIALYFANRYPQLLDRLILTCSGIFEYDERAFAAFYQFGGYVVAFRPQWLKRIPWANRLFMARFLHQPLPDADSQAFLEDFLLADYDAALGTIFASVSLRATEVMPIEFRQLAIATLLISGQYDQIIPAQLGQGAAVLNPKIQYVELSNTGHFPMLEDPTRYLAVVNTFLQNKVC